MLTLHTVKGVLRGYDTLVNLVLEDTIEYLRGTTNT
jgi:small nuclear ribonucleoprotein (snRNP)-like protein